MHVKFCRIGQVRRVTCDCSAKNLHARHHCMFISMKLRSHTLNQGVTAMINLWPTPANLWHIGTDLRPGCDHHESLPVMATDTRPIHEFKDQLVTYLRFFMHLLQSWSPDPVNMGTSYAELAVWSLTVTCRDELCCYRPYSKFWRTSLQIGTVIFS